MIPSPYSEEALKQQFRVGDAGRWKVNLEKDLAEIAKAASSRATASPPELSIVSRVNKAGKTIYHAGDIETDLILRATYARLVRQCSLSLPNREAIVSGIIEATSEASPFQVTKCDIRGFYESLDAEPIVKSILVDTRTSSDLKAVLRSIYSSANLQRSAAPRGLAISTVFAELALREFDNKIRKVPGVHRYFRYADDMIIFSIPGTFVVNVIEDELRSLGLELNEKTQSRYIASKNKEEPSAIKAESAYTYLGYEFSAEEVVSSYRTREFRVSISSQKLQKRKTRMFTSLHAFLKDDDGRLLLDRLNYLSTNRSVYKTKHNRGAKRQKIRTGIHYNYARCGHYPSSKKGRECKEFVSSDLVELDATLNMLLFSPNSEFYAAIDALHPDLKAALSKVSFVQGYGKRIMKRFSRERVGKICKVWGDE